MTVVVTRCNPSPAKHLFTQITEYLELTFSKNTESRLGQSVRNGALVRDTTAWTVRQNDGPNHLGMRCNAFPEHQVALITSDCAPFRTR